jgi:hypothetical protein
MAARQAFTGSFPSDGATIRWWWVFAGHALQRIIKAKYGEAYFSGTDDLVPQAELDKYKWIEETTNPED